jgi:hypothetical protein
MYRLPSVTVGTAHVARAQPVGRTHIRGLPHHEFLTRSGSFFFRLSAADDSKRLARLGHAMEADHQRGHVKLDEIARLRHHDVAAERSVRRSRHSWCALVIPTNRLDQSPSAVYRRPTAGIRRVVEAAYRVHVLYEDAAEFRVGIGSADL